MQWLGAAIAVALSCAITAAVIGYSPATVALVYIGTGSATLLLALIIGALFDQGDDDE